MSAESTRSALIGVARGELGVRERSGGNDEQRVAEYLAYCGLGEGYEWCAAFVSWCFGQVGLAEPRTPWSPTLFPRARQLARPERAQSGDVFGIWVREKGRIGHAGLVEVWDDGWCVTIEGNSGNAVRRMRRPVSTVYRVADWVSGSGGGGAL